ncbi:hypothetical protein [Kocuria sp. CPCC 205297]|uniref:hypothetical protein n=1 Tax=Kocuria sp. CPCC 205297 TaxID=3073558 RepID=UPI0034D3A184
MTTNTATPKAFTAGALTLAIARYKYRGIRDRDVHDFMARHGFSQDGPTLDTVFWMEVNRLRQDPATIEAFPRECAELTRRAEL